MIAACAHPESGNIEARTLFPSVNCVATTNVRVARKYASVASFQHDSLARPHELNYIQAIHCLLHAPLRDLGCEGNIRHLCGGRQNMLPPPSPQMYHHEFSRTWFSGVHHAGRSDG